MVRTLKKRDNHELGGRVEKKKLMQCRLFGYHKVYEHGKKGREVNGTTALKKRRRTNELGRIWFVTVSLVDALY